MDFVWVLLYAILILAFVNKICKDLNVKSVMILCKNRGVLCLKSTVICIHIDTGLFVKYTGLIIENYW